MFNPSVVRCKAVTLTLSLLTVITAHELIEMLLYALREWSPFKIDALGIVTLLGAEELNLAVGRLVRNRLTENFPVLAAYIVANNTLSKPLSGFVIYNITDGIVATDMTPWFARWLTCAKVSYSSTSLVISVSNNPKATPLYADIFPGLLGGTVLVGFMALAVITGDWWGFVNCVAMAVSVIVRRLVVNQLCQGIDNQVGNINTDPSSVVKCFCTLPDGSGVTLILEREILVQCLLSEPRPPSPGLYEVSRVIGWVAFGCHVLALGMACLLNQILSVLLLLVTTVLVVRRIGDSETRIASRLQLRRLDSTVPGHRSTTYAKLALTSKEEASMLAWNLFPHRSNESWWKQYRQLQIGHPL